MAAINMQAIQPLFQTLSLYPENKTQTGLAEGVPLFSDVFQNAAEQVRETDKAKNEAQYLMATGQLDNPAIATMASAKAQYSLDFMIQLRNKALDAYSELMRMSL